MKKILFIALLGMLTSFSYASPKIEKINEYKKGLQSKEIQGGSFFYWQVNYKCGTTSFTVCCFDTEAMAQAFADSHPASMMCNSSTN